MAEQCNQTTWPADAFNSVRCGNKGKVQHQGKWYCGIHSPEAKQKRKAKSDAHWELKRKARKAREKNWDRTQACVNAFHSPTRTIATEDIQEGDFWRLYDALIDLSDDLNLVTPFGRKIDALLQRFNVKEK